MDVKNSKNSDAKLWLYRFAIINLILICVWLFTSSQDVQFVSHFSFASTVTSIILSVLAIFMSISNESKTQTIREKIELEAETITKTAEELKKQMSEVLSKMDAVVSTTSNLEHQINTHPKSTRIASGETEGRR